MSQPTSTDRKNIMKQVLHEWWFNHGGETRYRTLKNFGEEIKIPEDSMSSFWRGRRFPGEKNYAKLGAVVPLNEIAGSLGHPVFAPIGVEVGQRNEPTTSCSVKVASVDAADKELEGSPPSTMEEQPVVLGLPMIHWAPASGEAFSLALRRWWEAEGVYEFGNRNQLSRSLQEAFPERNPSSVTWLRWFNGSNAPVNEGQVAFVNDVVRGFERWGFDPRERKSIGLPEAVIGFLSSLTMASPISAMLKKDAPSKERCDAAIQEIRVFQRDHGMKIPLEIVSRRPAVTQSKRKPVRPPVVGPSQISITLPRDPTDDSALRSAAPIADIESRKAMEMLRAELMSLRADLRSVEHDLAMGAYTGGFEIGTRKDGLRFVVTSDSFRPIGVAPTVEDVQDTERLIDELMRRFEVFAAHPSEPIRSATQALLQRRAKALLVSVTRFLSQWSDQLNRMLDMYRETLTNLPSEKAK